MKSKDQILLEKAYSRVLIKETPDYTIDPATNEKIKYNDFDASAFGFLSIVEPRTVTSWIMQDATMTLQDFPSEFQNKLYVADDNFTTHQELLEQTVADDIMNAPSGTITVVKGTWKVSYDMSENLDVVDEERLIMDFHQNKFNARQILAPAGRIWPNRKVVSFWVKEGEVTPEQLNMLFEKMKIPKEEADTFFIEFAGDKKPEKTVHDYTSGGASKKELSDEEEKRAAEAMAKAHGAAAVGTKDTAVQKVLSGRKEAGIQADAEARAAGRKPDLKTRQMAQTSEALETFSSFFNK